MIISDETKNPLYGLTVGSCVWETGKIPLASMINKPITKTIVQSQEWKSMSGVSSYAYTKEMNQGSFGIAGSYGFSGLSKLDVAVSGYVGTASATSGKSVKLNYQVKVLGGIEYIDFDNLDAAALCSALSDTTRQKLVNALDKYNALNAELDKIPGKTLLNVLADRATYKEQARLCDAWITAVNEFKSSYGDAMVIAVAWGGIGTVTMEITETSQDSSLKYGGALEFSYARTGGSIAVSAAYDGNQSKGSASVKVDCKGFASGSCVTSQVDEWLKAVNGKAFSELSDVKVLDKAPDMNIAKSMPSPPDFVKPKPTSTLASKLGAIKNLEGLDLYAKTSAYDKAVAEAQGKKPPQTPPDLATFLKEVDRPADVAGVQDLAESVAHNDIDVNRDDDNDVARAGQRAPDPVVGGPGHVRALVGAKPIAPVGAPERANAGVFSEYVPLGVWVSNWADLFPWLATGYLNSISGQVADSSIRYRVLIQDFLALSKLYFIADSCAFSFPEISKINFKNIANSFAGSCATLQESKAGEYEQAIQSAIEGLSSDALQIYKIWNKNSFLRSCELGLAVLTSDGYSPKVRVKDGNGVTEDLILPGIGNLTPKVIFIAGSSKCAFDTINKKPYTEFANCYKVLPLILPDPKGNGKIVVIGPGRGLLTGYHPDYGGFIFANGPHLVETEIYGAPYVIPSPWPPMEFTANVAQKTLENTTAKITLYPVPFSAANGIKWLGQAFSANVASDSNLTSQLNQIKDQLMNLPAWSLSSGAWKKDWTAKDGYSINSIRKQYVGMVDDLADKLG